MHLRNSETAYSGAQVHNFAVLGRSQAVRQRILIPPYGGSIPPAPAKHRDAPLITDTTELTRSKLMTFPHVALRWLGAFSVARRHGGGHRPGTGPREGLRAAGRAEGQGRHLGADAPGPRRPHAGHGQGDAQGLRGGPGLGRWTHGDHGSQARRQGAGHRVQPGHGGAVEAQRRQGRRRRQGRLHQRRHLPERFLQGGRGHHVPAVEPQSQAAPDPARHEARHPPGLQHLRHGRLEGRSGGARHRGLHRATAAPTCGSCRPRWTAPGP